MEKVKVNKEDMETIERIKSNPSLSDGLKNRMISDIINQRCPKCNSAMQEVELSGDDFGDMSEGQEADWEAGFGREFYCPKCQTTSLRDIDVFPIEDEGIMPTPAQLEALEKGRRTSWCNKDIKGYVGEMWFANKLKYEGFKVRKTMYYDYEQGVSVFNEEGVKDLLKDYEKKDEVLNEISSFTRGYPDLICLKEGKVSFVEVKTNNSEVKEHQKEVINNLKSMGYEVFVKRLDVDFSVEECEDE